MNPVIECLLKHKSIRKFKDTPVEKEKLDLIIKSAQAAPNWCNGQHVSIIAVKDKESKARLAKWSLNQSFINTCLIFLVFCADFYRTSLAFEKNGKDVKPFVEQLDSVLVGSHDVGIAMENAIIAAESMGLGIVCIGGIRQTSLSVVKELNLPKYVIPIVGLCIGYPDANPDIKPRLAPYTILFEGKYDTTHLKEEIDKYDEVYRNYVRNRGSNNKDTNWSAQLSSYYVNEIKDNKGTYDQDYELLKQQGFIKVEKNN